MQEKTDKRKLQIKTSCPECGKPRVSKGSITGWLFSEKHCTCFAGGLPASRLSRPLVDGDEGEAHIELPVDELGSDYQFLSLLGRGGMGSVYKVRDLRLGSNFAVKILNAELASSVDALKRFYIECDAAAKLTHANLVAVFGHGQTKSGCPYLIMDYVDGESLSTVLDREVYLGPGRSLGIFVPVAEALSYAHSQGLLHRDLKPANIMLTRSESFESVKLVDFGIAKALEANTRMTQDLTKTGDVLGTPLYMSPEQCLGFQLDCRSDIYSFGCLMVETLTGRPPFSGDNPMQIIAHHLNEAPIDAGERMNEMGIPTAFQDIAFTCLAKDPQDRYVEVDSLLADLIAVAEGRRPSVSGSRVSTNLRSPFVGLAIELLPFAVPVLGFTLVSVARPSGENRLIDHCAWSAFVSFLLFVFYLIKALHLKASSKLTNKRAAYFVRKFHSFLVTAIAAMVFCLSQVAVYVDFLAYEAAQTVEKVKYVPSWYFVVLWVALASIPFLVAASRRRREN